jgi:DNA polymerase I
MDVVLYGHNETPNIVAVQQLNESTVRLYSRTGGKVAHFDAEFFPFFFLSNDQLVQGFSQRYWIKELSGKNHFRYLVAFQSWHDMWESIRFILANYNRTALKRAEHYSELDAIAVRPDPVTQYLLQSGITLFKGMSFDDLHRMQVSIQTLAKPGKASDARKTDDRLVAIALSDNRGWEEVIDGSKMSEPDMLRRLSEVTSERDPDVIEGHDLFEHILPYMARRAELHTIDLALGRDGSSLRSFSPRGGVTERDFENAFFEVAGRHVIDTRLLAQSHDGPRRSLESFSLRSVAEYFGLRRKERVSLPLDRIAAVWESNPELALQAAVEDTHEVRSLSAYLSRSHFHLTQMCPLSYSAVVRTGSATKIELLLLREYVRQKHSVPRPQVGSQTTGGYADIFLVGLIPDVIYADIESLYPSIMLNDNIKPTSDELDVFPTLLRDLTTKRLDAKHRLLSSRPEIEKAHDDALQSSLKILINSFYGYLGYARGLFNDYEQADRVTRTGQELVRSIMQQVELHNGQVIEVDTDGLFCSPPDNVRGVEQEETFVGKISSELPAGIKLVLAGRYKKMLSYKKKNYALLDHDDRLTIRGSSLISRSLERFARNFIQLCINCLLQEDINGLHNLYVSFAKDLANHHWDAADFSRTETIRDPFDVYESEVRENKRKPAAAYEVARRSGLSLRPGDRVRYYVTGTHAGVKIAENSKLSEEWEPNFPDENTPYYLDRLNESAKKFEAFFEPADFRKIFSLDDLFAFSPDGIQIIRQKAAVPEEPPPREDEGPEFGIWLDDSASS